MIPRPFRRRMDERVRVERDVDDELAFHLAETTRDLEASGLSAGEARAVAEKRFGSRRRHRARLVRLQIARLAAENRRAAMHMLIMSMRSVVRGVVRSPGFTMGVIAILTLGLGVNAITFSLVDRLVLRGPAGVAAPGELHRVVIHRQNRSGASAAVTDLAYLDYRDLLASPQLAGAAAESSTPLLFGHGDSAERIRARLVTANYFELLGTTPTVGRFFTEDESARQGARLVVLSHAFWQRRFGGDPAVLGQVLPIESHRYTVVGVAARHFTGSFVSKVDVFLPLEAAHDEQISGPWRTSRNFSWVAGIVRLRPGVTPSSAEPELTAMHRAGRAETPNSDPSARIALEPLNAIRGATASSEIGVAALVWGVALLVLAIAAANVANLFLARALRCRDQLAVRLALGAGRRRILLEQACEGALLALIGAAVAVLVALGGTPLVQRLLFPQVDWLETSVDVRGLLFVAFCAVAGGSIAAALPMWRAASTDVLTFLRTGQRTSRTRTRTQAAMLLVQGALSVLLLIGAALFVGSLNAAQNIDLGIDSDRLMLVATVGGATPVRADFLDRLRERVARTPGVEGTTRASGTIPFVSSWAVRLQVPGLEERPQVEDGGPYVHAVEPGYFDVMGTRLVEGRSFAPEDRAGAPRVAIVNRTMAGLYWPGQPALGQCLRIGPGEPPCSTVIGVAENTRRWQIVEGDSLLYYVPLDQAPDELRNSPRLIARLTDGNASTHGRVGERVRREALVLEPGLRAVQPRSFDEEISPQLRAWRIGAGLFTVFGVLALIVAAVGLYSVVAFDVEGRRREMGMRTALGATSGTIVRLVLADGLRLAAGGVVLGLTVGWLLAPQIAGLLYGVPAQDVRVFSGVALVLIAAALVASAIPGMRAAHIDPCEVLRND
jgi:putative ABC transport system permease protein